MSSNIYWPVYKNIESEFNNLMFVIPIDDNQLNVYSSKISDLILRASTEIESISKELYKLNGGIKTKNIKYDEDALTYLNTLWNLENKKVIISSYNCFLTSKELIPFQKNEPRTGNSRLTYSWNNAYQNLKHDRASSLHFGSIKYLIDVTAALYVLNLYFKNDKFDGKDDALGNNFDSSLGSTIYNIKLHINQTINLEQNFHKNSDFDECVYLLKPTDSSIEFMQNTINSLNNQLKEVVKGDIYKKLEMLQGITHDTQIQPNIQSIIDETINENRIKVFQENGYKLNDAHKRLRYEIELNKNKY